MAVRKDPTAEVLETIAAMSDRDRAVAERLHEVITAAERVTELVRPALG